MKAFQVRDIVGKFYQADMQSRDRKRQSVFPRQVGMYLCREMTKLSSARVARLFGLTDHSTVLHSYNKIKLLLKADKRLQREIMEIRGILLGTGHSDIGKSDSGAKVHN
jgi:chromosomal replication initiator protein